MKSGGYPIMTASDLRNAIRAIGRAKNRAATIAHIITRAAKLGLSKLIPKQWRKGGSSINDRALSTTLGEALRNFDGEHAEINLVDTCDMVLDGGKLRRTKDGYATCDALVGRTGIQRYRGSELGRPNLGVVNVWRPPNEVFARDSLASIPNKPITLFHPKKMVDASNHKDVAVGHMGEDVLRDGERIRVPLILTDAATIDAIDSGEVNELSLGYTTDLQWRKGVIPAGMVDAGQPFDAVQTKNRVNHLAVVPVARGGSELRIGDEQHGREPSMAPLTKTIMLDGIPVETTDIGANVIQRHVQQLHKSAADLQGKLDSDAAKKEQDEEKRTRAEDALKDQVKTLTGQVVSLTKQLGDAKAELTDQGLQKRVQELAVVSDHARIFLGDGYKTEDKDINTMRRDMARKHVGDAVVKDMDDATVKGVYVGLVANQGRRGTGVARLADGLARSHENYVNRGSRGPMDAMNGRRGTFDARSNYGQPVLENLDGADEFIEDEVEDRNVRLSQNWRNPPVNNDGGHAMDGERRFSRRR
jgi:hypothetical protein